MSSDIETPPDLHSGNHDLIFDEDDSDEFIRKYGDIKFQYIAKPPESFWFVKPHALNYFKDGVLFRTKGERTSGKIELFLDLLYVGIVANLASSATEHASAGSFLKYILLFIPSWTVWSDIKDFVNYYYSEDLTQKFYLLWIYILLIIYDNNCDYILEDVHHAALTIVPYILCRISLSISLLFYSLWIKEHRLQMRVYALTLILTCALWIIVIFVSTKAKIGLSITIIFLEHFFFSCCYHPWIKKNIFKLNVSTALNIEHEVERFGAFFIIAIGEFLYKIVANNPITPGFNKSLARGICLLIIAYTLLWLYFNMGTSIKATHPLRRSGTTAIIFIYGHIPLIAGMILAADAAGEWVVMKDLKLLKDEHEEESSLYALSFFFTGGICTSLWSLGIMGFSEKSQDDKNCHIVNKFWRIFPRFPAGVVILCLSFNQMSTTNLLAFTTMICVILWGWESVTQTPKTDLPRILGGNCELIKHCEIERF